MAPSARPPRDSHIFPSFLSPGAQTQRGGLETGADSPHLCPVTPEGHGAVTGRASPKTVVRPGHRLLAFGAATAMTGTVARLPRGLPERATRGASAKFTPAAGPARGRRAQPDTQGRPARRRSPLLNTVVGRPGRCRAPEYPWPYERRRDALRQTEASSWREPRQWSGGALAAGTQPALSQAVPQRGGEHGIHAFEW